MSTNKSIAKSAGIIGAGTLLSRILGFMRDIVFAAFFGTGIYAQAFVVAFRIPNLLRDLIGEGATNAAVVPVLVEELTHEGKDAFWKLANILLNLVLVVLVGLTIIGVLLSKPIVVAIAPGFLQDPIKLDVTISLSRAIFPYLIFIGLAAYGMGVLNSLKHFTAPAFGMALLNVSIIICMLVWRQDVVGLAAGVLIGGFLQVLVQIPPLIRNGIIFTQKSFTHPKVKKILKLLVPRIFGTGIYQINVFVSTVLASIESIVGAGAVAALYFSSRIWQLPLAIFAIALAQAALPTLSSHIATNDIDKFRSAMNFLLRGVCFILLPATAGLIALTVPIIKTLFERGAFGAYSTNITSYALLFHSIGLLSFGAIKILVNGFYSMQDTKTPVKVAAVSLVLNVTLSLLLMYRLKLGGLALANSIAGIFNATLLFIVLRRKIGGFYDKNLLDSFLRILAASAAMGIAAFFLNRYMVYLVPNASTLGSVFILLGCISFSIFFYIGVCHLLQISELKEIREWILKRR